MLVDKNTYLSAGVHIGMKSCTKYMKNFVYRIREDGLSVFNLKTTDERISKAAKFLSRFNKIMVVGRKANAKKAIEKFAEIVNAKSISGRFIPGTITNSNFENFFEPDVLLITDPLVDEQAISEAVKSRIPIVAICDTYNDVSNIDFVIPANNNGKKSLSLIYMLLAREILKNRKEIKDNRDFKYTLKDFGGEL